MYIYVAIGMGCACAHIYGGRELIDNFAAGSKTCVSYNKVNQTTCGRGVVFCNPQVNIYIYISCMVYLEYVLQVQAYDN